MPFDKAFTIGQLQELEALGAKGIRLNFETTANTNLDEARHALEAIVQKLPKRGWHIQFDTRLSVISALRHELAELPCPIVFSHFGRAKASLGVDQPGFDELLWLLSSGKAYVKVSAPYRISEQTPEFPDVQPIVRALITANSDRLLWGSNWPHPGRGPSRIDLAPPYPNPDCDVLNLVAKWIPEPAIRNKLLVHNPAMLYRFGGQ